MTPTTHRRGRGPIQRAAAAGLLSLAACTVGPDYERPPTEVLAAYKEAFKPGPTEKGWRQSRPDDAIDRGAWWSIYRDSVLEGLERQIDISNQNLKEAEAAFRAAEALVAQARAGFFPTAQINAWSSAAAWIWPASDSGRPAIIFLAIAWEKSVVPNPVARRKTPAARCRG